MNGWRGLKSQVKVIILLLPGLLLAVLALTLPPIAQPLQYHDFADRRACAFSSARPGGAPLPRRAKHGLMSCSLSQACWSGWDRAAIALAFMASLGAILGERVGIGIGLYLLASLCDLSDHPVL